MNIATKPRVFISHSSQDKEFATELAWALRDFGFDVWYDEWEIAVGDSIVQKVFDGLQASDNLVVVLSPVSVASRWVKEELDSAVMRRISENDIRILPVLAETCEVPIPLRHLRYADFRKNREEALAEVVESLAPGHRLWRALSHLYDHFCLLSDRIVGAEPAEDVAENLLKVHSLLESALDVRTEIEFRRTRQRMRDLDFFEKIGYLVDKGVDVRSQTWNALVHFRACLAHDMKSRQAHVQVFAHMLKERYGTDNIRESFDMGMNRLKQIMHMICFEKWNTEEIYWQQGERMGQPNNRMESDEE